MERMVNPYYTCQISAISLFVHKGPFAKSRPLTLHRLPKKIACTCERCLQRCTAAAVHYIHSLRGQPAIAVQKDIQMDANSSLELGPAATPDFSWPAPADDGNTNVDKLLCMAATVLVISLKIGTTSNS
jgi:hypothetical protein